VPHNIGHQLPGDREQHRVPGVTARVVDVGDDVDSRTIRIRRYQLGDRPGQTGTAEYVPNNHRPTMSAVNDAGVGCHTDGAVKRVRGTE
jgi:hypothetical protein